MTKIVKDMFTFNGKNKWFLFHNGKIVNVFPTRQAARDAAKQISH